VESPAKAMVATLVIVSPWLAVIVFGWIRWVRASEARTLFSTLSLTGLAVSTASLLFVFLPALFSHSLDVARSWGVGTALAGVFFAVCGAWRSNPLRWRALASAAAMLLLWFLTLVLE
jgi:hypothetical protein